jgi:sugar (pentulose or hexulose) kinase
MPLILGIDLGTTTISALALDTDGGAIVAACTLPNKAETTSPTDKLRGRCEWDVRAIANTACACLKDVAGHVANRQHELAGVGITGQQHGVLVVDRTPTPLTPFINWQDRRAEESLRGTSMTYVRRAVERVGAESPARSGCRLAAGYLAVTLFWMKETGCLPQEGTACFLMDYFGALLTGQPPVTDTTCAASGGVLDLAAGAWDDASIQALGLPRTLFPEVRLSGNRLGGLTPELAAATGLPAGLPIFGGIGDNQASFLGSVAQRADTVLVNVGTGGQVAAYGERFVYDPLLETRPFPRGGYLLVSAGLCGGASYAVLERFFRQVGSQLFQAPPRDALYELMNQLAATVPPGADGLRCEPFFTGTRLRPELRASWTGVSATNFTPGHLARALLEGLAEAFRTGLAQIRRNAPGPWQRLVGAGNGLRANPLLARIVTDTFGMPLSVPHHREEAAYGAALMAAVGAGIHSDWAAGGRLIRYEKL